MSENQSVAQFSNFIRLNSLLFICNTLNIKILLLGAQIYTATNPFNNRDITPLIVTQNILLFRIILNNKI